MVSKRSLALANVESIEFLKIRIRGYLMFDKFKMGWNINVPWGEKKMMPKS